MSKLSTTLIVALSAFFIGLASASVLKPVGSDSQAHHFPKTQADAMGNVIHNQD